MMTLPPPSVYHDNTKYLPTIEEGNKASDNYIYKPSHKGEGKLAIPSKRPTDLSLSNHGWQNLRRVRPDTPSGRLLQVEQLNQEPILVEIVRPSIWQLRRSPATRGLNRVDAGHQWYQLQTHHLGWTRRCLDQVWHSCVWELRWLQSAHLP